MITKKEEQLQHYFELSKRILEALQQGAEDLVPGLLEQREVCISSINKVDGEAGSLLMSDTIREQLNRLTVLEKEIQSQLQLTMRKLSNRIRSEQRNQFIKSQYEDLTGVSKGVFYDRTK
ncbi:flagellar protein FliT [Neobacillus kokaensis]|uniref:Flagellar protein FliT n=1 Tax=Neobacillus kokaensis TaxID=2759023 RepID=A0ABQ3N8K2_9BACI|nr:flagellar protein FliT [Neobacillus kokaensis]GHH99982.1 hypothetical protein AM1BK_35250 [Neobacillus kokaensis]